MQIKSLVRFPLEIRRAHKLLARPRASQSSFANPPVVLDLQTTQLLFDCGRHLASLAHFANAIGSPLWLRCDSWMLAGVARKIHGREMLGEAYVRRLVPTEKLPADAFVLTDVSSPAATQMLIGRDCVAGVPTMPYPMHPWTLPHANRESLRALRQYDTRSGIFFAGNQKPKYGSNKITEDFGMMSRLAVLDSLRQAFPDRLTHTLENALPDQSIIISDSRTKSIAPSDWLATLARARFFICCPGASQPTCHNLVEAMSVGTIPLIEYDQRVTPALRDGVNAITFRGKAGLLQAIKRIDSLPHEELQRMGRNAAEFYDEHLAGERFLSRLREAPPRQVNMPFHDVNFFKPDAIPQPHGAVEARKAG